MKKSTLIYFSLISLVLAAIVSFNSISFSKFVIFSLIFTILIFGASLFLRKVIMYFRRKEIGKGMRLLIFGFVLGVLGMGIMAMFVSIGSPAITPNHFRTNILTGKCDFGKYNSNRIQDPWYYKQGCDLPKEKLIPLIDAIKDTRDISVVVCRQYCTEKYAGEPEFGLPGFCERKNEITGTSTSASMSCKYLVDCPSIKCSNENQ